jgi:hypothetical protein
MKATSVTNADNNSYQSTTASAKKSEISSLASGSSRNTQSASTNKRKTEKQRLEEKMKSAISDEDKAAILFKTLKAKEDLTQEIWKMTLRFPLTAEAMGKPVMAMKFCVKRATGKDLFSWS